ncbi:hypothetical protein TWF281_008844 [Arthrobotrys megalospora]
MLAKMLNIQNKYQRPVHTLLIWTSVTFILVGASTYFLSQRPAIDYFPSPKSTPGSPSNATNPLLTEEGIDQLILDHSFPRLGERANFTGLHQLCNSTKWQKHVYWTCTHNMGGLMNVRNMVLNCVRYAIAAGASGLVLPQIEARDPTVLSKLKTGDSQDISFLFDRAWFKEVMQENCEQMELFDRVEDITNYGYAMMPDIISMQALMGQPLGNRHGLLRNKKPEEFRSRFDQVIKAQTRRPNEKFPVIIRLDDKALFSFPPAFDPPAIANNFGFILEFRLDLSGLANIIVDRVRQALNKDDGKFSEYVGVHLRSEADAGKYWASWDELANSTLSVALDNKIRLIYVASGDADGVAKLTRKAEESGIRVVDKWSILSNDEQEFLHPFRFDQQAIVDYLALMRSDRFVGSGQSSFSSHLIMRREFLANVSLAEGNHDDDYGRRDQLAGPGRLGYWDMDWP